MDSSATIKVTEIPDFRSQIRGVLLEGYAVMANPADLDLHRKAHDLEVCAFALTDCTVQIESQSAKYLRAVHRTALELAVPNLYGAEIGGFWLRADQIAQLRTLPDCYPANETEVVRLAVEAYLQAQTDELDWLRV